jgi:hypothetical protein
MKPNEFKAVAGFCRKCNAQILLSGKQYSCECGTANANSYCFPSSWAFHTKAEQELPKAKSASQGNSGSSE